MKICFKCKEAKMLGFFSPSKCNKDGFKGTCKRCINSKEKENRALGIGGDKDRARRYRLNNPEKRKQSSMRYNSSLLGRGCSQRYLASENGKIKRKKLDAERRYREKIQRLSGIKIPQKMFKLIIKDLESKTGIKYCMDHIMPLKHDLFSGLHVPWNIQIVPYVYNAVKGNKI